MWERAGFIGVILWKPAKFVDEFEERIFPFSEDNEVELALNCLALLLMLPFFWKYSCKLLNEAGGRIVELKESGEVPNE